jgi:hypothetical protein
MHCYVNQANYLCFIHRNVNYSSNYSSPGQISSAKFLTNFNFVTMSSYPSKLPSSWLAKPHYGLTPILLNTSFLVAPFPYPFGIKSAATNALVFMSSKFSISGNLLVINPRITFLFSGRNCKGSNPALRYVLTYFQLTYLLIILLIFPGFYSYGTYD